MNCTYTSILFSGYASILVFEHTNTNIIPTLTVLSKKLSRWLIHIGTQQKPVKAVRHAASLNIYQHGWRARMKLQKEPSLYMILFLRKSRIRSTLSNHRGAAPTTIHTTTSTGLCALHSFGVLV